MLLALLACDPAGTTRSAEPGDPPGDAIGDSTAPTDTTEPGGDDTATSTTCIPRTCDDACGTVDDGCGSTLDCGGCGPWASCEANQCQTAACVPDEADSTDGGGRCEDLAQAWTARGINVGYYPFRVVADLPQYSGDYDGPAGVTFTRGTTPGVILQIIPAGSFVGLSSTGPYYDPAGECLPSGECGDPDVEACTGSSPPLRPGVAGYYWGYAYQGASHMQGWIYADPSALQWAGDDASHPCADGPAGADYEVATACGAATSCSGARRTCGDANRCDEGIDDCGSTSCGASSGGALTPSAHRSTVTLPTDGVHDCTTVTPPDPSIRCLANGSDADFFYVYPHGAYLYWAQNSTTKAWIHYGDTVQAYFHTRDGQGVLWDFVEVLSSGAPVLTPASDGAGGDCTASDPSACTPCLNGGTCGWVQDVFLQ